MTSPKNNARVLAMLGLVAVLGMVALLVVRGDPYTIRADFQNTGQIVEGGRVQVAGREIGTISSIELSPEGLARVELSIDDESFVPLHEGTRADIRALGQAGVANRRVEMSPGLPDAPALESGSLLPLEQTSGIVDLDALLSSFGPGQRTNLRKLLNRSANVYAGSGSDYFNSLLGKLDPGLAEAGALSAELAADSSEIANLIRTANSSARAIASRRVDLTSAIDATARSFGAIADERRALAGILDHAPATLSQARKTLANAELAVDALRPALREAPAAGPPLREFLQRTSRVVPAARPVVRNLRGQLPDLRAAFAGLAPLEKASTPALSSAAKALGDSEHILRGGRFYGTDLYGIMNGLVGLAVSTYTDRGRYGHVSFIQPPQTLVGGRVGDILGLTDRDLIPGIIGLRTGLTRRCPGGNAPPAIDGSSPLAIDASLCDPSHNIPASVNEAGG